MDLLLLLKAAIMGIVEGITEFLPISSTGHLILAAELMDFWTKEKSDVFVIAIQMGAIAAVIYEYWTRLWGAATGMFTGEEKGRRLGFGLIMASIPIILIGLTFGQTVKELLFNDVAVAIGLIIGGFIIMWIEKHPPQVRAHEVEELTYRDAIWIGLIQVLSLIPGLRVQVQPLLVRCSWVYRVKQQLSFPSFWEFLSLLAQACSTYIKAMMYSKPLKIGPYSASGSSSLLFPHFC